jgi:hypothetical protein
LRELRAAILADQDDAKGRARGAETAAQLGGAHAGARTEIGRYVIADHPDDHDVALRQASPARRKRAPLLKEARISLRWRKNQDRPGPP